MVPKLYELGYLVQYKEGDISLHRTSIPFIATVEDKYHVVKDGDTLLSIAQEYYDDCQLWYILADANPIVVTDIFELTVNTTLLIPSKETLELLNG